MKNKDQSDIISQELFQLMKQFTRVRWKKSSIDGLTRSAYELLVMLSMGVKDGKQAFTVTEVSNLLQVTPAGVTHLINPLEESGYIERLPDPHDRRVVRIGLTGKGALAADARISEVQENLTGLIHHMGEDDIRTLIRLMSNAIEFFNSQYKN